MPWRVGIDVGGTFTDVVAIDDETGERRVGKTSSTPEDPSEGFTDGLAEVMKELGLSGSDLDFIGHGTTVATNAILEAKYARMGLIVNRGYREMLEVARQTVPGDFGNIVWWIKPPRVVPLELVREVGGRLNFRGEELQPLDEEEVARIASDFKAMGIGAVAISLLHSYRNPIHEQALKRIVSTIYPECYVSISADVIREYREYERTLSTCLNTGLMPLVSTYVERIRERLDSAAAGRKFYVMKSSGGIVDSGEIITQPIAAVLSGPAAGVVTAGYYASRTGHGDCITMDIGGTSTDICLIDAGVPHMLTEGRIDVFDIKTPMVDMHTVGAGGGSIAWLAAGRSLRVGPQSAGAAPGPVCYRKGGNEPTVTDAHLVLGRVSPYLLGGGIELDVGCATDAIERTVGKPLGLNVEEASSGILDIATANIAQGINVVSVKRGRDPRDYALFAFGGAGGLTACLVAEQLGIATVVIPPAPGVTSAEGLLFTDVRADGVITDVQREDALNLQRLAGEYEIVKGRVTDDLIRQGFGDAQTDIHMFADMRYAGQAYEIRVPLHGIDGALAEAALREGIERFHELHDDRYGYSYAGRELVELVNVGATGIGRFNRPVLPSADGESRTWESAWKYERPGYFRQRGGYCATPIYDRALAPVGGPLLNGPAVIEQYDATLVVEPGWVAMADGVGQIIIVREDASGTGGKNGNS